MLNFNTKPYYDDFNEDKNFHKILFKPGVAVQARELTQVQSILQDQIGKFGKFVLSDGSIVNGGKYSINANAKSLNLADIGNIATDIPNFAGAYVVGETSRCVSLITSIDVLNYYIGVKSLINGVNNYISGETLQIFIRKDEAYQYLQDNIAEADYTAILNADYSTIIQNCSGQINSNQFTINSSIIDVGDIITAEIDNYLISYIVTEIKGNSIFSVNKQLTIDYNNVPLTITKYASRVVLEVNVEEGVYFTNNCFVKSIPQTVIPNNKTQYPSCVIGFEINEVVIDFIDDTSLLDPAQGSYNYTAPGADRYKIYLNLVTKPLYEGAIDETAITTTKFIELLRLKNGIVISDNVDPTLGDLEHVLAKQLYDHAGNFTVSPFTISFNNSDFSDYASTLNCSISAGKAYVFGYEFNASFPTNIAINKARETANSLTQTMNTYYGNTLTITDVGGILPIPKNGTKVALYSVTKYNITGNTPIGYAYIRNIDFATKNIYELYLYNLTVPQLQIQNIKSISAIGVDAFSANVLTNSVDKSVLKDTTFNKLLYKLAYTNIASLNISKVTLDLFNTYTVTSNVATITTNSLNVQFPTGLSEHLSLEDKNQNFIIVPKGSNGGYSKGQYVDMSTVDIAVSSVGSTNQAVITFTNGYTGQIDVKYSLTYTSPQKKVKTLHKDQICKINSTVLPTSIGYSDIVKFKGVYKTTINPDSAIVSGDYNSETTYAKNYVVRYSNNLYISITNNNKGNYPSSTTGFWSILQDVTSKYSLNNGQNEYMYDFGTIAAKNIINVGTVFVLFDYYTHSDSGEYISYDSYPVAYNEIPIQSINHNTYSMTDYIDFRPRRKNSTNSDNIEFDSYKIPSSITDSNLNYSMSYYLGRIDKLVLTKNKKLSWLNGVSSYKNYIPPKDLPNAMTLATVQFDPYSPDMKSIKIKYAKHHRYTMDDIGELDARLQNVEYYTALNIAEKSALSTNISDLYGTRLKNGFIVDSFTNFNVIDFNNINKNISLDIENAVARPFGAQEKFNVTASFDQGETHLIQKNNLIAFNYTESPIIVQNQATGSVKINQFDTISYLGDLYLTPQSDVWTEELDPIINNASEDTAAMMNASEIPGLVYNDWNAYYSTHPYIVEKENSGVTVNYNNVNYQIQTVREITKSTKLEVLAANIIPKTRNINLKFKATGLAPLTRMFVYINGHLVNGYVTPNENPTGTVTFIKVINPGTGYANSGVTGSIINSSTDPALFNVTTVGGSIESVVLTNPGKGYNVTETLNVSIVGSNTNTAIVQASAVPIKATNLYSNKAGECSGYIDFPTKLLSFPVGEIIISVCDTPHYDLQNSIARSDGTYYSKITYTQTVIDSIRKPYITKTTNDITQALPVQTPRIVVPASTDYLVYDYSRTYDSIKSGSINIPVFLSQKPTADVVVSFLLDASEDISSNSSISTSISTLTFTTSNWNTIQNLPLTYNLGNRQQFDTDDYFDNNLPTHIEFYASSADSRYDYGGTAIPLKGWLSSTPIKAVESTHLVPYKKYDPNAGPASVKTPFINVSNTAISNTGGQSFFTVNYGGGNEIGWWTTANTTYPLIFTATVANTDIAVVTHSTYEDYEYKDFKPGGIRTILKSDQQILMFKYWMYGKKQGTTSVTVSVQSTNPNWNNITETIPVTVGAELLAPTPQIVVHPHSEIKGSSGVVLNAPRITSSTGTTQIIGLSLSKAPTSNVSVLATSSKIAGGGIIYKVSEDGLTLNAGNTVIFTPNTWNNMKTVMVQGSTDPTLYHQATVNYNVTLSSTSSDATFNNLSTIVALQNNDAGTTAPVVVVPAAYVSVKPTLTTANSNEGVYVEFTVLTTNVTDNTELGWKLVAPGGGLASIDLHSNNADSVDVTNSGLTSGTTKITNNKGTFGITFKSDLLTESYEYYKVAIYDNTGLTGTAVLTSDAQRVNDTSTTPYDPPLTPVPTYSITFNGYASSSTRTVDEGVSVRYNVSTTNVSQGTTLYWRLNTVASTANANDFAATSGQTTTVDSSGNCNFTVSINADKTTEGPEGANFILSTTSGGTEVALTGGINITDSSQTEVVTPVTPVTPDKPVTPAVVYPGVEISASGTYETFNHGTTNKTATFHVKLSVAPVNGDVTVSFSSDNTSTGGTVTSGGVLTSSNYKEGFFVTVTGVDLGEGISNSPVKFNLLWAASGGGVTNNKGSFEMTNLRYSYSTTTLSYTETSTFYKAKRKTVWTPTATLPTVIYGDFRKDSKGNNIADGAEMKSWQGRCDGGTATISETGYDYIIVDTTSTLRQAWSGAGATTSGTGWKTAAAGYVQFSFTVGSSTVSSSSELTASSISAEVTTTPLKTSKGTISSSAQAEISAAQAGYVTVTHTAKMASRDSYDPDDGHSGEVIGPSMGVKARIKISGLCMAINEDDFEVTEYTTGTTISNTYRTDTYELIDSKSTNADSSQVVSSTKNAQASHALAYAINSYPLLEKKAYPDSSVITKDINAAQVKVISPIVDSYTTLVNAIKAKNPAAGSVAKATLDQLQGSLDAYSILLAGYKAAS